MKPKEDQQSRAGKIPAARPPTDPTSSFHSGDDGSAQPAGFF